MMKTWTLLHIFGWGLGNCLLHFIHTRNIDSTSFKITNEIKILDYEVLTFFNFFIGFLVPGKRNDLQCFISGECSNGQELNILPSKDELQCLESCQQTANCTWFSFYPDSSTCNLLSSCATIEDTNCSNCISGERECDNPKSVFFVPGIVNF